MLQLSQMPIREACHVAVQRNHPTNQKLWKHAQARQQVKGEGPNPVLQIVSLKQKKLLLSYHSSYINYGLYFVVFYKWLCSFLNHDVFYEILGFVSAFFEA